MDRPIEPDERPDDVWPWDWVNGPIERREPQGTSMWWFVVGGLLGILLAAVQTC